MIDVAIMEQNRMMEPEKKKSHSKFVIWFGGIVVAFIAFLFILNGGSKVDILQLEKVKAVLYLGETDSLMVIVKPKDVTPELIWESSDERIAVVSDGKVIPQKPGLVVIKVSVKNQANKFAECEYRIQEPDVDMQTLDILEEPLILRPGGHQQLRVSYTPANQNEMIKWSSTDESVVKVSLRGKVEALKVGSAFVIATSERTRVADTAKVSVEGPLMTKDEILALEQKLQANTPKESPKPVPTALVSKPTQTVASKPVPTVASKPATSVAATKTATTASTSKPTPSTAPKATAVKATTNKPATVVATKPTSKVDSKSTLTATAKATPAKTTTAKPATTATSKPASTASIASKATPAKTTTAKPAATTTAPKTASTASTTAKTASVKTTKSTSTTVASKPAQTSGTKNFGYATYKGSWPNDVKGRMDFKSSHVIDSRDPKERVAEAGDYVIGEWSDGHLVQGIWYGADNKAKGSILIGK